MSNPTPEQQNESGYVTKYTQDGRKWWTVNGIDWYPLTDYFHDNISGTTSAYVSVMDINERGINIAKQIKHRGEL